MTKRSRKLWGVIRGLITAVAAVVCCVLTLELLKVFLLGTGAAPGAGGAGTSAAIMNHYDTYITNSMSAALDGVVEIERVYWLSDDDLVAPEPNPDCFGQTDDPSTLQWLLDEAEDLLDGQQLLFSTDTPIIPGSTVHYYLDDTILNIVWKQMIHGSVYTISEVKIAHPSQFRRFLADGTYGSEKQYLTTEMAATVNAVTASSGDFYKFRGNGVVVYNCELKRAYGYIDTCFIDENGDLLFARMGQLMTEEKAREYLSQHNIRFSLAFGPVLVNDGEAVFTDYYELGEHKRHFARSALAQMGELHYLMMAVNRYDYVPTTAELADQLVKFGVEKAYALDGGQTATIVMNDMLINVPDYGAQREISDIIYFATAIPNKEET